MLAIQRDEGKRAVVRSALTNPVGGPRETSRSERFFVDVFDASIMHRFLRCVGHDMGQHVGYLHKGVDKRLGLNGSLANTGTSAAWSAPVRISSSDELNSCHKSLLFRSPNIKPARRKPKFDICE
jgi:hypothetical protein